MPLDFGPRIAEVGGEVRLNAAEQAQQVLAAGSLPFGTGELRETQARSPGSIRSGPANYQLVAPPYQDRCW
jgi:hypothetical protein